MASETVSEVRNEPDQRKVDNGTSAGITEDQQKAPLGTPVCSSSHRTQNGTGTNVVTDHQLVSPDQQTPAAAVQIAQSNLPKLAPLGRKQVVSPIRAVAVPSRAHAVQSIHPSGRKQTAAPSEPKPVEIRNTADYSSSSSDSVSNSSDDEKRRKYSLRGLPQSLSRNVTSPSRAPFPSRLAPLTSNSQAVHRGHEQIVYNFPPPPQQRPLPPLSQTQPPLAYHSALAPLQARHPTVLSRALPPLSLPGRQHMPFVPSAEAMFEQQHMQTSLDGDKSPVKHVGPGHTNPAVVAGLSSDSDDPMHFASSEPIHEVAQCGNISELKRQISELGADFADHGLRTPLMYAVLGNQKKACQVLLKAGAKVNKVDSYGMTALLWAAHLDKPQTVPVLLRYGADINVCDPSGRTVFHWSAASSGCECLRILVSKAAKGIIDEKDKNQLTALHWAVMCEHHTHIQVMISEGHASVGIQDSEGRTPLNYAVLNYSSNCVKAILDCDESAITIRDNKGRTALHYACAEGNMECIRVLALCPSCEVNYGDNRGTTALHWAAAGNQPEVIRFLLRRQADKTKMDSNGMTALDHARTCNHTNCIEVLEHYSPVESSSLSSLSQPAKPIHHQSTMPLGSSIKTKLKFPLRSRFSVSSSQTSTSGSMTELGEREDGDGSHGNQRKGNGELKQTVPEGGMLSGNSHSRNQASTTTEQETKRKTRRRRFIPWLCGSASAQVFQPFTADGSHSVSTGIEAPVPNTTTQPTEGCPNKP